MAGVSNTIYMYICLFLAPLPQREPQPRSNSPASANCHQDSCHAMLRWECKDFGDGHINNRTSTADFTIDVPHRSFTTPPLRQPLLSVFPPGPNPSSQVSMPFSHSTIPRPAPLKSFHPPLGASAPSVPWLSAPVLSPPAHVPASPYPMA